MVVRSKLKQAQHDAEIAVLAGQRESVIAALDKGLRFTKDIVRETGLTPPKVDLILRKMELENGRQKETSLEARIVEAALNPDNQFTYDGPIDNTSGTFVPQKHIRNGTARNSGLYWLRMAPIAEYAGLASSNSHGVGIVLHILGRYKDVLLAKMENAVVSAAYTKHAMELWADRKNNRDYYGYVAKQAKVPAGTAEYFLKTKLRMPSPIKMQAWALACELDIEATAQIYRTFAFGSWGFQRSNVISNIISYLCKQHEIPLKSADAIAPKLYDKMAEHYKESHPFAANSNL